MKVTDTLRLVKTESIKHITLNRLVVNLSGDFTSAKETNISSSYRDKNRQLSEIVRSEAKLYEVIRSASLYSRSRLTSRVGSRGLRIEFYGNMFLSYTHIYTYHHAYWP